MGKKVKLTAVVCGMTLAIALTLNTTQAFKNDRNNNSNAVKTSLTKGSVLHYKGGCKGNNGMCMSDSVRTWYGDWYEN